MTNQLQEKDLRDMAERVVRMETKMDLFLVKADEVEKLKKDLERVKEIAVRAEVKADQNKERLSKSEKIFTTVGGTVITFIVVAILELVMKGGL